MVSVEIGKEHPQPTPLTCCNHWFPQIDAPDAPLAQPHRTRRQNTHLINATPQTRF
jgi:hypothetical protein